MRGFFAALVLCGCGESGSHATADLQVPLEDLGETADLSANADLTAPPDLTPVVVSGRLIDSARRPLAGLQVLVGGAMTTSDSTGAFSFSTETPYTLTVGGTDSRGVRSVERWEGLSRTDPTLMALAFVAPSPSASPNTISAVFGGVPSPLPASSWAYLASEDGQISASLPGGRNAVFSNVAWGQQQASSTTQIDALAFTYSSPRNYLGWATVAVTLTSAPVNLGTLNLSAPPTKNLTAHLTGNGLTGGSSAIALAYVGTSGYLGQLVSQTSAAYDVSYALPDVGAKFNVTLSTLVGSGGSSVNIAGLSAGATLGDVAMPDAVDPVYADAGVSATMEFQVTGLAAGKVYRAEFYWPDSGLTTHRILHTTQATFHIPDGTPFGFPAGGSPGTTLTWRGTACTLGSAASAIDQLGGGQAEEWALPAGQPIACYSQQNVALQF
jgi:hypothetical protein